jgi:hypothetical protein
MTKFDWAKANKAEMPKVARSKTETQKRQEAVAQAYANGTSRERERIIKLIKEVVSEHQAREIENVPSRLLIQLIEKGTK